MKKVFIAILAIILSTASFAHNLDPNGCPFSGRIGIKGTSFEFSGHDNLFSLPNNTSTIKYDVVYGVRLYMTKNNLQNGILRWDTTIYITSGTFTLTAPYFNALGDSVFFDNFAQKAKSTKSGSTWSPYVPFDAAKSFFDDYSSTTFKLDVVRGTSFNGIIKANCTVTPITLKGSFEGRVIGTSVKFNWTTATEINNDRFEIEEQVEGNFVTVATIKTKAAGGNSTEDIDYEATLATSVLSTAGFGILGMIIILSIAVSMLSKKNRESFLKLGAACAIFLTIGLASCSKTTIENNQTAKKGVHVFRLKQVDIDGKTEIHNYISLRF